MHYRILGAGPSGLAAAITLAKSGHDVDVFERRRDCGARFGGDLQGIENWSTHVDALDELHAAGVTTDFHCAPISRAIQTNGRRDSSLSFSGAGLYLVKRGTAGDTLDQSLKRQALAAGVRLHFRESIQPESADILATGPRGRKIFAIDRGIVFETDAADCAVVLMNDEAAPKGYAYLLVTGGYGCLCTMLFEDFPSIHERLAYARRLLESRYGVTVRNPRPGRRRRPFHVAHGIPQRRRAPDWRGGWLAGFPLGIRHPQRDPIRRRRRALPHGWARLASRSGAPLLERLAGERREPVPVREPETRAIQRRHGALQARRATRSAQNDLAIEPAAPSAPSRSAGVHSSALPAARALRRLLLLKEESSKRQFSGIA